VRKCPACNSESSVTDSRPTGSTIRRRRVCKKCEFAWSTIEVSADALAHELQLLSDRLRSHSEMVDAQMDRLQAHKITLRIETPADMAKVASQPLK
jgi:transposase-like protein